MTNYNICPHTIWFTPVKQVTPLDILLGSQDRCDLEGYRVLLSPEAAACIHLSCQLPPANPQKTHTSFASRNP